MRYWRVAGAVALALLLPACLARGGQTAAEAEIKVHRARIDAIDAQVVGLLSERAEHALAIARARRGAKIPESTAKARQEQVLAQAAAAAKPPLPAETARAIYRAVLDEMIKLQQADAAAERK